MGFAILVFIAAFLIESIGTYTSVIGLSALFAANPVIITLAVCLDFAKIVTVSFLYREWEDVNKTIRAYMVVASSILILITSAGAAGFLAAEFQKAIIPTKAGDIQIQAIVQEKAKLELRKKEIDTQITNLPANVVRGRQKLMDGFKTELAHLNSRTIELDAEIPKIQIAQVDKVAHAGPILYIAEAFDSTPEKSVKWVILLIIFVFDPLAIVLILAGNYLLEKRETREKEKHLAMNDHLDNLPTKPVDALQTFANNFVMTQEPLGKDFELSEADRWSLYETSEPENKLDSSEPEPEIVTEEALKALVNSAPLQNLEESLVEEPLVEEPTVTSIGEAKIMNAVNVSGGSTATKIQENPSSLAFYSSIS